MKNLFKRIKENLKNRAATIMATVATGAIAFNGVMSGRSAIAKRAVANNAGDGYIDVAVRILIAVVLGGLLLAGLYLLFGETVLPELTRRIKDMFNYNG